METNSYTILSFVIFFHFRSLSAPTISILKQKGSNNNNKHKQSQSFDHCAMRLSTFIA